MFPFDIFPIRIKPLDPETIFILYPTIFLELLGIVIALLGFADDWGILDATIGLYVWIWVLLKKPSPEIKETVNQKRKNKKSGFTRAKAFRKLTICSLLELIPVVGTVLTLWSYMVYIILKEDIIAREEYKENEKELAIFKRAKGPAVANTNKKTKA